jgi:DNA invertase Pin-like site-specific DNA recombinase
MGQAIPAIPEFRARGHVAQPAGTGLVPVAFVGRTSTSTLQDPVESLAKQVRLAQERLPDGFFLARWYWDVESGGIELDSRSQTDIWRQFADAGIPRDGGMAELRAAVASGQRPVSAVICENISRSGRDMLDSLRLEKELRTAGVMIFATNEPIDARAPQASTMLVRRMHQAEAEYFRYNLKTQMWEGLKQYAISGHNTGPCPYGYAEDRTPHPNPMKASMGATRARLVPHPEHAQWVTRMFTWRVYEKLSVAGIARRLTALGVPTPKGEQGWSAGTVHGILANPKYTGKIVLGRTTNAGPTRRKGETRFIRLPREYWTWADDANAHEALIDLATWEQARKVGQDKKNSRDAGTRHPRAKRFYPYRGRLHCRQCGKRMHGAPSNSRHPGEEYIYYVCPTHPHNPVNAARWPGHIRAAVREDLFTTVVSDFLDTRLFSHDRREQLAKLIPATQDRQDELDQARAQTLRRQLAQAEQSLDGIAAETEQLAGKQDPATAALRDRLAQRFSDRYDQKQALKAQLKAIEDAAPLPGSDLTLLDELPHALGLLALCPPELQETLAAALDMHVVYRADDRQATITLTITATTPGIIATIAADPRVDSDTGASTTSESATEIDHGTVKPTTSENASEHSSWNAIAPQTAIRSPARGHIPGQSGAAAPGRAQALTRKPGIPGTPAGDERATGRRAPGSHATTRAAYHAKASKSGETGLFSSAVITPESRNF